MINNNFRKLFPNTSTVAYYNPFGQHIVLNSIEENQYLNAIKDPFNLDNHSILKTVSHELRHWKDHHSTLWGIRSLIDIYNAINARLLNDPKNFHYITKYIKNAKKSDLTEYYHTVLEPFDVKANGLFWKWKLSVGSRFDPDGKINENKPIPFVRFLNPLNDNILSRTPLSNSSLLETNAIAEEIKVTLSIYRELDEDQLLVETKLTDAEYLKWLYNNELTLYSAIAHLASSITEEKDIISTFNTSSQISNLLLNLPENQYKNIPINEYLNEFGNKNELLKSQNDNGFSFLNLILNYKDKFGNTEEYEFEKLLEASNLPKKKDIEKQIIDEFNLLKTTVIDGPFRQKMMSLIDIALKYFTEKGLDGAEENVLHFLDYHTPTLVFADTYIDESIYNYDMCKYFVFSGIPLTNTGWYFMQVDIFKELDTFYNICGI